MTLNERINRALSRARKPGPEAVARRVMAEMTAEERDAALADCIVDRVRIQITRARLGDHASTEAQEIGVVGSRTHGPSKWQVAAQVWVPEAGWKFEVDLTLDDLLAVAAEYSVRSVQMQNKAKLYYDRAQQLRESGCATWGEFLDRGEQAA